MTGWREISVDGGKGFRAVRDNAVDIPNTAWTTVVFNTEIFDSDNEYNTADGKYTPTKAGYYTVHGNLVFTEIPAGGVYIVALRKNNAKISLDRGISGGAGICGSCASGVIDMNGSTDYLLLECWHNTGSAEPLFIGSGYNTFSAWMLSSP